jgi:hypothetical protein
MTPALRRAAFAAGWALCTFAAAVLIDRSVALAILGVGALVIAVSVRSISERLPSVAVKRGTAWRCACERLSGSGVEACTRDADAGQRLAPLLRDLARGERREDQEAYEEVSKKYKDFFLEGG